MAFIDSALEDYPLEDLSNLIKYLLEGAAHLGRNTRLFLPLAQRPERVSKLNSTYLTSMMEARFLLQRIKRSSVKPK